MIFSRLQDIIRHSTAQVLKSKKIEAEVPAFEVAPTPSKVPGDVAANVALVLAKTVKMAPRKLAEEILAHMAATPLIKKAEIAGAGFLNFWLSDEGYADQLANLVSKKFDHLKKTGKKILIEFVSANPTGPLHIGHGRGAALGDSLVRVFRYLGHEVSSEFYVNDAGGQIRNLGFSMEARLKELKGESVTFPEAGYKGSYVIELAKEALSSKKTFKSIQDNQMIFDESDLAGFASHRILKIIQKSLENFDVHFDHWMKESDLHRKSAIPALYEQLEERNLSYEKDGALWFRATDFGDEKDRVLQKANEAPTYFASDIAYHLEKYERGYEKLINIWGADHHGYAQRMKGVLKALGKDPEKLVIIFNQLVSIKGGRLSKRAGDMILLDDVVEEVGRDATRFFFALRSPGAHFEFDLDLAKKQASDNPVFYVQYVHARCSSILAEAEKRGQITESLAWQQSVGKMSIQDEERAVLLHLSSFGRIVETCADDLSMHHMTVYLLELAGKYHSFYEKCRVLEDEAVIRSFRLDLIRAIRRRVAEGLALLGVTAPDRL